MNSLLKTSKKTAEKLTSLQATTGLTKNILSRIALALSLRDPSIPGLVEDKSGIDIRRNAITREEDYIYKSLISQNAQRHVSDEEYFPDLLNAHLERGIILLENQYNHVGSYEKLLQSLLRMEV